MRPENKSGDKKKGRDNMKATRCEKKRQAEKNMRK